MRFEELKPDDYRRIKEAAPIAYLPWGAHEWHGKQNPLGLDTLKAHGQCMNLCAETGGIVFPEIYCGYTTMKHYNPVFDCTLEFSADCVRILAKEYLDQLANEGFKVIIILMGHYGHEHQLAIKEIVEDFNNRQDASFAWAFPDYEPTESEGISGEHAACYETSYIMYLRPELVDMTRLPQDRPLDINIDGISGPDPRSSASAKKGRDGINVLVKNAAPKILELLSRKTCK
ncbi:MAG: creatininase family protein [Armatimonadota bacterium]